MISQLRTADPGGSGNDFVELLNVSNSPQTLPASWTISETRSDDNEGCGYLINGPQKTLQPGQHYLVGGTGTPRDIGSNGTLFACSGGGFFTDGNVTLNAGSLSDTVSYGSFPTLGPAPIPEPPKISAAPTNGQSLRRLNNGYQETESNATDFASGTAIPQSSGITDPAVSTGSAGGLTATTATLNGTVNAHSQTVTNCHFDYGTTMAYGSTAACSPSPSGSSSPTSVSANVTGLSPSTGYHFRVSVTVAGGTFTGSDQPFTTPGPPPAVTTGAATAVGQTAATLNGTVNPLAETITDCHFDWGTTTSYGHTVACASFPSGNSAMPVSGPLTGLTPSTTYHFRLVSTDAGGSTMGTDNTFTTQAGSGGGGGGGTGGGGAGGGSGGAGGGGTTAHVPPKPHLGHKINRGKHTARFTFRDTGASRFQCSLVTLKLQGKKPPKPRYSACHSPKKYKRLKGGSYEFFVRGANGAGNGKAATFKFKI